MGYRKTTVEIDVEELQKAQESLQTHGIKETVNAALREVNRRSALREAAAYVLSGSMHVPDEEAWAGRRETRSYLPQFVGAAPRRDRGSGARARHDPRHEPRARPEARPLQLNEPPTRPSAQDRTRAAARRA